MLLVESLLGSSSAAPAYIEDVFSTYLYTGNGLAQTINNGVNLSNASENVTQTSIGTLPKSISRDYGGIAFGGGKYVIVGDGASNTTYAAYSSDGASWTATTLPVSQVWLGVSYCPGYGFVAIGKPSSALGQRFARSADGITWTDITLPSTGFWYSITNNGTSTFVAVSGNGTNKIAYSTNGGVSWTIITSPNSGGLVSVSYGNGRFVAVNILSTTAAWSTDGITWTASTLPYNVSTVAFVNNKFVVVNGNGSNNTGATTFDGVTWTAFTLPESGIWNCIAGSQGVVCISSTSKTLFTTDFINWSSKSFIAYKSFANSTQVFLALGTAFSYLSFSNTVNGLVWLKGRSGATDHALYDTARGATFDLVSNSTAAQTTQATGLTAFGATGFTIGSLAKINTSSATYASWTFRKQAKFFDIVTYTGTGANRTIAHNLGSVPGCIMIKRTDTTAAWAVYHRSLANTQYLVLNTTAAAATETAYWNSTTPTSSVFSLGPATNVNASGGTYVAYLFAHDAGGFGRSETDNVISCGSFTTDSSGNASVTLGYEPQFVLVKRSDGAPNDWYLIDNMRGMIPPTSYGPQVFPNKMDAEVNGQRLYPTATGFALSSFLPSSANIVYIAIRRGPMKTPTSGTSVYNAIARTGNGTYSTYVSGAGFPIDLAWAFSRSSSTEEHNSVDRLRGPAGLFTQSTQVEDSSVDVKFDRQDGIVTPASTNNGFNNNTVTYIQWFFRRAPGFFDVVCYTGTGANRTVSHNLGVAPELMIVKQRAGSGYGQWFVYNSASGNTKVLELQDATSGAYADSSAWNNTSPTSSVFTVGTSGATNYSGSTFVAYLFATVAGVSKVGSYTGSGTTKQIDCGFTNGARFVLIRRTDSGGGWYVWDSARGIVAGNDPYLLLNSTAAEVTNTDYIDTYSAGFEISSTAPAAINANGGSFIFLAIA